MVALPSLNATMSPVLAPHWLDRHLSNQNSQSFARSHRVKSPLTLPATHPHSWGCWVEPTLEGSSLTRHQGCCAAVQSPSYSANTRTPLTKRGGETSLASAVQGESGHSEIPRYRS